MAASKFLQNKAKERAKKVDEKYGEGSYGGSSWREETQSSSQSVSSSTSGKASKPIASSFLQNKAKGRASAQRSSGTKKDSGTLDAYKAALDKMKSKPAYGGSKEDARAVLVGPNKTTAGSVRLGSVFDAGVYGSGASYVNLAGTLAEGASKMGRTYGGAKEDARAVMVAPNTEEEVQKRKAANKKFAQAAYKKADDLQQKSEDLTKIAKDGIGKFGQLLVDAGINGTQMLGDAALNAVAPGAGLYALGARSFGGATQEARQQGATYGQQLAYGGLNAATEVLTEKMFDGLAGIYGKGFLADTKVASKLTGAIEKATAKLPSAAKRILTSMGEESIEELVAGVIEPAYQYIYGGEGYTEDTVADVINAMLVGGMLGGLGGSVETVGTNIRNSNTYAPDIETAQALVDEALAINPDNKLAQKAAERLQAGRNISGGTVTSLIEQNETGMMDNDKAAIQQAVEQRLYQYGEQGDIPAIAKAIAKQTAGERLSYSDRVILDQSQYANRVLNELDTDNIESGEYASDWTGNIGTTRVNPDVYGRYIQQANNEPVSAPVVQAANDTEAAPIVQPAQAVGQDGGVQSVNVESVAQSAENGESNVLETNDQPVEQNDAEREDVTVEEASKKYGAQAGAFRAIYQSGQSVAKFDAAYGNVREYAMAGTPLNTIKNLQSVSYLTDKQIELAYETAVAESDANAQEKKDAPMAKDGKGKAAVRKRGTVKLQDGVSAKSLNAQQKRAAGIIRTVAEATGVDVVLFQSGTDAEGNFTGEEGKFVWDENKIYVDLNAGLMNVSDKGDVERYTALRTFTHEFVHFTEKWNPVQYNELRRAVFDAMEQKLAEESANSDTTTTVDDLINRKLDLYRKAVSADFTYEQASREVVADSLTDVLQDSVFVENMYNEHRSLFNKIVEKLKEFVANIKAYFASASPNSKQEARLLKEEVDGTLRYMQNIVDVFDKVAAGAVENYQASQNVGVNIDTETESANATQFSERTWTGSDYVQERDKAANEMAEAIGIPVEKAKAYIDDVNSVAKAIANDRTRLDYEASEGVSSFVSNTEYGGSIDFSTICKKRRLMTGTFSAIQNALPNTALTAEEVLTIRKMMDDNGYEVSCGLCYVEGSRAKMGEYAKDFLDQYAKTNPEYLPNMAEINTPDGIEKVRMEHPDVYEAYRNYMNKLAQRKPKLYQMATEYKGEVLDKFSGQRSSVAEKNKNGGLRLQSFSDFEIIHLIDCMQVVMDMSRVGLAGQAYTKVPDFAAALGATGTKINLSLIAKGVDENGNLILDEKEGMKQTDAKRLRDMYSDNVGTIIVVFNDEQLRAAMKDSFIDFIIPFHRSQWNKAQYALMGLPENSKDYTMVQNESYIEPVFNKNGKKTRPDNYMPNAYWDFSKTGKENAEAYLKMCALNNRKPKFSHLLVDNKDGSYGLQPDGSTDGYWKLLIDFKMYNNDGVGVPQQPVKPNFNMDEAMRMLDEYKGGHQSFPVAQDIVDEFVGKYKADHKGVVQLSVRDTKQAQFDIIQQANPAEDDYHTWIRNVDDIMTLDEAMNDSEWADYDEYNPDWTREMAQKAFATGKVTVYSSKPIANGIFVSPSKMEAQSYSANGKVYSKTVPVGNVAWIDPTQGQYAEVKEQYAVRDSDGKQLSKGQQNYFADSKVRDADGNLEVVYHASDADFNSFDVDRYGSANGHPERAIFFTNSNRVAKQFASKSKPYYLNIKNPLDLNNLTDKQIEQIAKSYKVGLPEADIKRFMKEYISAGNYYALKMFIDYSAVESLGYDGVIVRWNTDSAIENGEDSSVMEYALFNSNQAKLTNNTNPTEDEDIRYSVRETDDWLDDDILLDDEEFNKMLAEEFKLNTPWDRSIDVLDRMERGGVNAENSRKGYNSQGKKLSEGQNKYFADSKVRDDDGSLRPVYHYTDSNFTKFEKMDASKGSTRTHGDGYYFSTSEDSFAHFGKNKMVMYANITYPFEMELPSAYANAIYDEYFAPHHRHNKDHVVGKLQNPIRVFDYLKEAAELNNTTTSAILSEFGYDGIHDGIEWVAFESNQLKSVDNLNPTDDPDIRYQIRESNLSNRDVLGMAAEAIQRDDSRYNMLNAADRSALEIFQKRLNALNEAQTARRELLNAKHDILDGKEKSDLTDAERNELRKVQNNLDTVNGQIKRAEDELMQVESKRITKKILKQAREIVDKDARRRGVEELRAYKNKRNDSEAARKYRKRIQDTAMELSGWLKKNSDKEHVPEVLKQPVAELIASIDFSSKRYLAGGELTKADKKFSANLMDIKKLIDGQQGTIEGDDNAIDKVGAYLDISKENRDFLNELANTIAHTEGTYTINRMSAAELQAFSKFMKNLATAIRKANRVLANARYQNIPTMAQESMEYMDEMGNAKLADGTSAKKFMQWSNATPFYAFKRFGKVGESIFDGFTRGWEKLAFNAQEIIDFTDKTYTTEEIRNWRKQIHKIELEDGTKIEMTTAQIMALSQLVRRDQAMKHIAAGGIRVGNIQQKRGVKQNTDHHHFTQADLANVLSKLTDRQLKVAHALQKYMSTRGSEWGNEVSMARFGYEFYGQEGDTYYPIKTDSNGRPMKDTDGNTNSMFRLLNLSSSKSLNPNANNALIVEDIFDTFADHMADMAKLNALGLPLLDAIKWYNYTERNTSDDGTMDEEGVKKAMEKAYGPAAGAYFRTLLKDINGVSESGDRGGNLASKMMSNYKIAAVAANLRVALLQPTSYVRAMYVLKPKNMINALMFKKNAYKEAMKYSGTAVWKSLGYYDTDIAKSMRSQIEHDDTWMDRVKDKSMVLAELGDQRTWGRLWVACKLEAKQQNSNLEGEELNKATADKFREVIYSTQVMDSTLTRSEMMRGQTRWTKIATAFMAEPTLSYNILMDSASQYAIDVRKNGAQKAWQKNKGVIGRSFVTYLCSAAAAALVESLMDAMRDDDDYETFLQKFMQAFFGEKGFMDGNLGQDLTIIGKIPVLKDILNTVRGNKSSDMSIASIESVSNAYRIWKETADLSNGKLDKSTSVTWNGKMTEWGKIYKTLQALSQTSGFAAANLTRDAVAIWNSTVGSVDPSKKLKTYDPGEQNSIAYSYRDGNISEEEALSALVEKGFAKNKNDAWFLLQEGGKYDAMYKAIDSDNSSDYSEALRILTAHGVDTKDAHTQAKSRIKTAYEEGGLTESEAISKLTKYAGKNREEADVLIANWKFVKDNPNTTWESNTINKYNSEVKQQGISVNEYDEFLGKMKNCKGEDADGDGKTDSGSKKVQVLYAIDSMNISDQQKDFLYYQEGYTESKIYEAPWH